MSNKKETVYVKANGLRNELKDIRKSIDKLTNAIIMAQTHKQHEYYETSTGGPYRIHTVYNHDTTDGVQDTTKT